MYLCCGGAVCCQWGSESYNDIIFIMSEQNWRNFFTEAELEKWKKEKTSERIFTAAELKHEWEKWKKDSIKRENMAKSNNNTCKTQVKDKINSDFFY